MNLAEVSEQYLDKFDSKALMFGSAILVAILFLSLGYRSWPETLPATIQEREALYSEQYNERVHSLAVVAEISDSGEAAVRSLVSATPGHRWIRNGVSLAAHKAHIGSDGMPQEHRYENVKAVQQDKELMTKFFERDGKQLVYMSETLDSQTPLEKKKQQFTLDYLALNLVSKANGRYEIKDWDPIGTHWRSRVESGVIAIRFPRSIDVRGVQYALELSGHTEVPEPIEHERDTQNNQIKIWFPEGLMPLQGIDIDMSW